MQGLLEKEKCDRHFKALLQAKEKLLERYDSKKELEQTEAELKKFERSLWFGEVYEALDKKKKDVEKLQAEDQVHWILLNGCDKDINFCDELINSHEKRLNNHDERLNLLGKDIESLKEKAKKTFFSRSKTEEARESFKVTDEQSLFLKDYFGFFVKSGEKFAKYKVEDAFLRKSLKKPWLASKLWEIRVKILKDYSVVKELKELKELFQSDVALQKSIDKDELSKFCSEAEKTHRDLQRALGELLPWVREEGEGRRVEEGEKNLPNFRGLKFFESSPTTIEQNSSPSISPQSGSPQSVPSPENVSPIPAIRPV